MRVAEKILNKQSCTRGQPARGGPPAWSLGEVLTTPLRRKLNHITNNSQKPRTLTYLQANTHNRHIFVTILLHIISSLQCTKSSTSVHATELSTAERCGQKEKKNGSTRTQISFTPKRQGVSSFRLYANSLFLEQTESCIIH